MVSSACRRAVALSSACGLLLVSSPVRAEYIHQDDPNFHEPTECFHSAQYYSTSPQCTEGVSYWTNEAARLESQLEEEEPGVHCTMNQQTHQIQCATNSSCWGGGVYDHEVTEASYTYNCAARCGSSESLLEQCCDVCMATKHGSDGASNNRDIHCMGCDKFSSMHQPHLRRLGFLDNVRERLGFLANGRRLTEATPAPNPCEISDNGTFFCNRGDGCHAGQPDTSNESWNCHILPCNHCSDAHLKAECCAECFRTKCAGTQRTACLGCDFPGMGLRTGVDVTPAPAEAQILSRDAGLPAVVPGTSVSTNSQNLGFPGPMHFDWTALLTILTCVGICASLAILGFLAMRQSECISDSSSSEDEKLVPVAVTIMPPQAGQGYAVQQTNWQQYEPASMQQRPAGMVPGAMPTTMMMG
jgi:hypothetical protein